MQLAQIPYAGLAFWSVPGPDAALVEAAFLQAGQAIRIWVIHESSPLLTGHIPYHAAAGLFHDFADIQCPNPSLIIIAARGQDAAVGSEGQSIHRAIMLEPLQLFSGLYIPQSSLILASEITAH